MRKMGEKIIGVNKKQLSDAIRKCPYLNSTQKEVLIYFVLFSSDEPELSLKKDIYPTSSVSTTVLHIANFCKINVKHAYKVINKLKQRNIIIEIKGEGYKNSTYQVNNEELKKIINIAKCEELEKNWRKNY